MSVASGPRTHGRGPYSVALLHGGPGSIGDMGPVARELAARRGVLEPWSTAGSLEAQLDELHRGLLNRASFPIVLGGHSWGAWLGYLYTARHPELVRKLILIDCPPFEEHYEERIQTTRASRLTSAEAAELKLILRQLASPDAPDREVRLGRLNELTTKTDAFDPIPAPSAEDGPRRLPAVLFRQAWLDLSELRQSGRLLELAASIRCPVVAIHGCHDPIPAEGVTEPLQRALIDFRVRLLAHCGHTPWKERQARDAFFQVLESEV